MQHLASAPPLDSDSDARPSLFLLLTASAGCAMTVLDSNIVAVILPAIARDFTASFAEVEWVVSAYVLCFASLLLPAGAIADRFGRRRIFLIGVAGFALTSLLCGSATSAAMLYLARAAQGAAAAFLLAPALAIIADGFHDQQSRNRAWAIWGTIMGFTMVLAPMTGGVISTMLGWRAAFWLNLPILITIGVTARIGIAESSDKRAGRLDPIGIVTFAAMMFAFTWGLISGQAEGWGSAACLVGLIAGVIASALFVIVERRQSRPMLDLALFANPNLAGSVLAMFAYAASAQVMTTLLPQYLQNGIGLTAIGAGGAMLPFAVAMLLFPHAGRLLSRRMTSGQILVLGLAVVACGDAVAAWGAQSADWSVTVLGMIVIGAGGGLLNGETQKAIMAEVPRARAGMASGISTTVRFSGILLGFALLSGVLGSTTRSVLVGTAGNAGTVRRMADAIVAGETNAAAVGLSGSTAQAAIRAARAAYALGFSVALCVAAALAAVCAVAVWMLCADDGLRVTRVDCPSDDGRRR